MQEEKRKKKTIRHIITFTWIILGLILITLACTVGETGFTSLLAKLFFLGTIPVIVLVCNLRSKD